MSVTATENSPSAESREATAEPNQTKNEYATEGDIGDSGATFQPALWRQRRSFACGVLRDRDVTSVLDFGCGEGSYMSFLIPSGGAAAPVVTKLAGVDVDPAELERAKEACKPWFMDHENLRELPLVLELYEGSIAEVDERFDGYDAAVCMEVIEHLDPPVLEALPHTLFGKFRRKIVIISTPNSEFNIHFDGLLKTERGDYMRHHDHHFEWTRKQFERWATTIAQKYNYTVRFSGVGVIGDYDPAVGHCSQIAVFEDPLQSFDPPTSLESSQVSLDSNRNQEIPTGPYRQVSRFEFPWYNFPDLPESETIRVIRSYVPYSCTALTKPETIEYDRFLRLAPGRPVFLASFDSLWSVSRIRQLVRHRDVLYRHLAADPEIFTLILPGLTDPSQTVDARNLERIFTRDYDRLMVLVHPETGLEEFGSMECAASKLETEDEEVVESDQAEDDLEDYSYRPAEGDTTNEEHAKGWEGTWSDRDDPCQGENLWNREPSGWDFHVEPI